MTHRSRADLEAQNQELMGELEAIRDRVVEILEEHDQGLEEAEEAASEEGDEENFQDKEDS